MITSEFEMPVGYEQPLEPDVPDTERAEKFKNPYDTPVSSGLRFLMDLAAWIAVPWWAWEASGPISGIPTFLILLAIPAVFSTTGDKWQVIVPTPGPIRLVIELGLFAVAVLGASLAWSPYSGVAVSVIAVLALLSGCRRMTWLLKGAPLPVE